MVRLGFHTLCCDVFGVLKCVTTIIKIVNNNTNDKQPSGAFLALDEDSPYTNSCLFTLDRLQFFIVVTQKLVLLQSKNIAAKCTETLSPPPCIQFSLRVIMLCLPRCRTVSLGYYCLIYLHAFIYICIWKYM